MPRGSDLTPLGQFTESIQRPDRPKPPDNGGELLQLTAWTDFYRATLIVKCSALGPGGLQRRPVGSSNLSQPGLTRRKTFVERVWFESTFADFAAPTYYGREVNLRRILIHMIEEYARHCGHADILRELIDGSTGY